MRTTIVSTAAAVALLLSGCGGGDDESGDAVTAGDAVAPTSAASPEVTTEATAEASSEATTGSKSSSAKPKPNKPKDDGLYDGPGKVGPYVPPLDPLLPAHEGAYPASQLEPEYSGDTIVSCADAYPLDRILKPVPATKLSADVKAVLKDLANVEDFIVAVADKDHVQIMEQPTAKNDYSVEYWDVTYEFAKGSSDTGRWRYYHDIMSETCSVSRVLPDLRSYSVSLTAAPKPGDRALQVSVFDQACGGVDPNTLIKVPILNFKPDAIRLAIGRDAYPESAQCSGKYTTFPYTVQLPEPVGNRAIIDVGDYPEDKVTVDAESGVVADSVAGPSIVTGRQASAVVRGRRRARANAGR